MKFWSLSICFVSNIFVLIDVLEAQTNSPLICEPEEVSKGKFNEETKVLDKELEQVGDKFKDDNDLKELKEKAVKFE